MPIYEYRCEGCGKRFQLVATIAEHRRGSVTCPGCRKDFALLEHRGTHALESTLIPRATRLSPCLRPH